MRTAQQLAWLPLPSAIAPSEDEASSTAATTVREKPHRMYYCPAGGNALPNLGTRCHLTLTRYAGRCPDARKQHVREVLNRVRKQHLRKVLKRVNTSGEAVLVLNG